MVPCLFLVSCMFLGRDETAVYWLAPPKKPVIFQPPASLV
jgi:hypothetical protein